MKVKNYQFQKHFTLENVKIPQKFEIQSCKIGQKDQKWFHVKSERQKNAESSTLCSYLTDLRSGFHMAPMLTTSTMSSQDGIFLVFWGIFQNG